MNIKLGEIYERAEVVIQLVNFFLFFMFLFEIG